MATASEVHNLEDAQVEKKLSDLDFEKDATPVQSEVPPPYTQPTSDPTREKQSGPLKTPILKPVESAKPDPPAELTADQKDKYELLLETVKAWTEIPSTQGNVGAITDNERMWLTRECLLRYLRATKWSSADAAKRLLATLTWRRDYGVESLTGDLLSPENETGKQIIVGYDIAARPCHYLNPGRQNTNASPRQVQHLVFMVERVIDMMVPGVETLSLLINFKASKTRSNTAPGIGQGREVLNILQTHYPERLGRALIINVPWIVNGFFKLITPFIDPLTREKLKFNDDMRQHVPPEQLWNEFHGDLEFEYDHTIYWSSLLKLCEEKQAEHYDRWVKAGKHLGESEVFIRGGDVPSVGVGVCQGILAQESTSVPEEMSKEPTPVAAIQDGAASKTSVQSSRAQLNGTTDTTAKIADPVITMEGDRP